MKSKNLTKTEGIHTIVDTDPWYDPDDLFALTYLLNSGVTPSLIVTGDEVNGKRAALTKWFLNALGRSDIPVATGALLEGKTQLFCEDLILGTSYHAIECDESVNAIRSVVEESEKTIYIGINSLTNLANTLSAYPELKEKISLYQMGGALDIPRKRAEHNIRIDIPAARSVLLSGVETHLALLDTTLNQHFNVSDQHPLYHFCKHHENKGIQAIAKNIDAFHDQSGFWTFMHDPLAVSSALGHSFVTYSRENIAINQEGIFKRDPSGVPINISNPKSRDLAFMDNLQSVMQKVKYS